MRDEPKMDANRLIMEVYKRPALWNQKHISYHNRDVTNRIWMEIAALFKLPKQVLKTKWKGLRDTFRAEIKKEEVYRKSNYTPTRPIWIHFKTLQFLKEQMLPRPPIWEREGNESGSNAEKLEDVSKYLLVTTSGPKLSTERRKTAASSKDGRRTSKRIGNSVGNTPHKVEHKQEEDRSECERPIASKDRTSTSSTDAGKLEASVTSRQSRPRSMDTDLSPTGNLPIVGNAGTSVGNAEAETIAMKIEPLDTYDDTDDDFASAERLGSIGNNNHGPMVQNIPSEALLMADQADSCVIGGDPLESNRCYDDNYYFFMSLLPHIRTLPAERRMLLRMQMQQLVYQEVYNRSQRSSLPTFLPTNGEDGDRSSLSFPRDN